LHKSNKLFLNFLSKEQRNSAVASLWRDLTRFADTPKSEGAFRRQPENSAAIACIQHKSLINSTQLRGYSEGFVINAG